MVKELCTNEFCPTHGHTGKDYEPDGEGGLPFSKPIEVAIQSTVDGHPSAIPVGCVYQNKDGIWARTDRGLFNCKDIEEAIGMVNEHVDMEARGLRRIDPPAAVVQKDDPCTTFIGDSDKCLSCRVRRDQHGGAFTDMSGVEGAPLPGAMPTRKSPYIEDMITFVTGKDRRKTITEGGCTTCDTTGIMAGSFKSAASLAEYKISGLCQPCQDKVFT